MRVIEDQSEVSAILTDAMNLRGILRGVQCVCGQWWPDFKQRGASNEFQTECCGSLYLYSASVGNPGGLSTLSLLHDNRTTNPA